MINGKVHKDNCKVSEQQSKEALNLNKSQA